MEGGDFLDQDTFFPGLMLDDSETSELDLAPEKSRARAAVVTTRNSSSRSTATTTGTARHPDQSNNNSNSRKPRRITTSTRAPPPKEPLSNPGSFRKHHQQQQQQQQQQQRLEDALPPSDLQFLMPDAAADNKKSNSKHSSNRVNFDHEFDSWEEDLFNDVGRDAATAETHYTTPSPPPSYRTSNRQYCDQSHQQRELSAMMTTEERLAQIARLCVAASGRLVTVARENRHLAVEAGARLDEYVLRPCLRAGAGLARTYCPEGMRALRDAEAQVRRAVMGGSGSGSGSGSGGGGGGAQRNSRGSRRSGGGEFLALGLGLGLGPRKDKGELVRLKDRLVEQDALLRDWHAYTRRLMRERDGLRRRLSVQGQGRTQAQADGEESSENESGRTGQRRRRRRRTMSCPLNNNNNACDGDDASGGDGAGENEENNDTPRLAATPTTASTPAATTTTATHQQRQLAEQLRELQMLVDQLTLHGVLDADADGSENGDDYDDARYDFYDCKEEKDDDGHHHHHHIAERDRKKKRLGVDGGLDDDDENHDNDDGDEDWTLL